MKTNPLRLLLAALLSVMLVVSSMAVPASARSDRWQPRGWSGGSSHYGIPDFRSVNRFRNVNKPSRSYSYRGSRHYQAPRRYYAPRRQYAPRYYTYRKRQHHDDSFIIGLGLGFLGAAILSAPYYGDSRAYRATSGFCHVHRYKVRGMTFHRDVRCFKHRNWNDPSIDYVQ
ncbi:MAG: hypothetical protein Q8P46_09285 [Hyphomicrobiales bacterium]|nr:hypothetical protein [Hyphomicrobiales bacterium]